MDDLYKPNARAAGLVVQQVRDETLVYDISAHRAYCLNGTAAFIWSHCDGRHTVRSIARRLSDQPDADDLVWLALDQLAELNLLEERARGYYPWSRRQVMRTLSVTALIALPLISTIATPTDNRGTMSACVCTSNAQCLQPPCSGTCSGVGICM